jgi:hypothetical protein
MPGPRFSAPVRWVLRGVACVVVVWLIASVAMIWLARSSAVNGLDRLQAAREKLSATALLRGEGHDALAAAGDDFQTANDRAGSPVLAPWKIVPLIRQNVQSTEALTAAATTVARVSEQAAAETAAVLEVSPTSGAERIDMLRKLEAITARAARRLQRVDLGPDFFLVAPLGDARDRFLARLEQLRQALSGANAVASGAERLLIGPRHYLVLAANNGEMRAGSGMLLSAGVATFQDGTFTVGALRPTPEFNLPPGTVPVPPELQTLWGWLRPTSEWRNLATTPRFDVTAPLAADMWHAATGGTVDGVLAVDPETLRAVLAAQGPIDAAGRTLSADDVVGFILRDQYAGVSSGDPQAGRRDMLGEIARAAMDTLQTRPWKSADLVGQLGAIGRGRHVLVWSRDPVEQAAWAAGGIDGALHGDSLAVSLLNVGANKLDQFVHVDARLSLTDVADDGHDATLRITVRNEAPTGLSSYVSGPYPGTDLAEGEYRGILAVNAPGVGSLPLIVGAQPLVASGLDGPTKVAADGPLRLARGATQTVTVRFRLPAGFSELTIEPSARIPPVTWHFAGRTWFDDHPERLEW